MHSDELPVKFLWVTLYMQHVGWIGR